MRRSVSGINFMHRPRKFRRGGGGGGGGGGVLTAFFLSHKHISKRTVGNSIEKQLNPSGPIASPGIEVIKHEFILKLKIKRNDY